MKTIYLKTVVLTCLLVKQGLLLSNPIPIGIPYITMITEDMDIIVDADLQATMHGVYTFDVGYYLDYDSTAIDPPPWNYTMYFPKPKDAGNILIRVDGETLDYQIVDSLYLTTADSLYTTTPIPASLDSLDMIQWSFTIAEPKLICVEVTYTHALVEFQNAYVFLYTLGTGRYVEGWKPPFIGGDIEGKPWVDVSITTKFLNTYRVNCYYPDTIPYAPVQVNQYETNDTVVFDWEAQNTECGSDFILELVSDNPVNNDEWVESEQALWMDITASNIRFNIPCNDRISLQVYDMNGRLIKTLLSKEMIAGQHEMDWTNVQSEMSEGIYIVMLKTSVQQVARRYVVFH